MRIDKERATNNLIASLYALGVSGYAALTFFAQWISVANQTASIVYRGGFLVLTVGVAVLLLRKKSRRVPAVYVLPVFVFWDLYILRLLLDTAFDPVSLRLPITEYYAHALGASLAPMIAFMARPDNKALDKALKWTLGLTAFVCVVALVQNAGAYYSNVRRFTGNEGLGAISFGHLGVSLTLLSAFIVVKSEKYTLRTGIASLFMILGLVTMGLAASRGPLLALVVAALFLPWIGAQFGKRLRFVALLVGVVLMAPFFLDLIRELGSALVTRVSDLQATLEGQRGSVRFMLWSEAWTQFANAPIMGSALELKDGGFYPHNIILESLMATGIVGGTALIVSIILGGIASVKVITKSPQHGWVVLLFVQYAVASQFSYALYQNYAFWYFLGAVLMLGYGRVEKSRSRSSLRSHLAPAARLR